MTHRPAHARWPGRRPLRRLRQGYVTARSGVRTLPSGASTRPTSRSLNELTACSRARRSRAPAPAAAVDRAIADSPPTARLPSREHCAASRAAWCTARPNSSGSSLSSAFPQADHVSGGLAREQFGYLCEQPRVTADLLEQARPPGRLRIALSRPACSGSRPSRSTASSSAARPDGLDQIAVPFPAPRTALAVPGHGIGRSAR